MKGKLFRSFDMKDLVPLNRFLACTFIGIEKHASCGFHKRNMLNE